MTSRNKITNSLKTYIESVKPYHTKLRDLSSSLIAEEAFGVRASDSHTLDVVLSGIIDWNSPGCEFLNTGGDGVTREFRIPRMNYPRFSLNTSIGQMPVGDDPPHLSLVDTNFDGIPDSEELYSGPNGISRQIGITDEHHIGLQFETKTFTIVSSSQIGSIISGSITLSLTVNIAAYATIGLTLGSVAVLFDNQVVGTINLTTGFGSITFPASFTEITEFYNEATIALPLSISSKLYAWAMSKTLKLIVSSNTGRYKVSFHTGSKVYLNGVLQILGTDYVVTSGRTFIQFLAGKHPQLNDSLKINLINSDRLFISVATPYEVGTNPDYYLITADSTYPNGVSPPIFISTNTLPNKPTIKNVKLIGYPNGTLFKLTAATYGYSLRVQKINPGAIVEYGILRPDVVFSTAGLTAEIDIGWQEYYLSHDNDSYAAFDNSLFGIDGYQYRDDESDFLSSYLTTTEKQTIDFNTSISKLGTVSMKMDGQQIFTFDVAPTSGYMVRFRVEQATQYIQRAGSNIVDSLNIVARMVFGFGEEGFSDWPYETESGIRTIVVHN